MGDIVDGYWPCQFVDSPVPSRAPEWGRGGKAPELQVQAVPTLDGWELRATYFGGEVVARSRTYRTHRQAALALDFVSTVAASVGDPRSRNPVTIRAEPECGCLPAADHCRHHPNADQAESLAAEQRRFNAVSLSIRPAPRSRSDWEVVVRDQDGYPIELSTRYPSGAEAAAARDFALKTINSGRPARLEGWVPTAATSRRYPYVPPSAEEAVTVRVSRSERAGDPMWRLQARHPNWAVLATSLPYPDQAQADSARDFLGILSVLAGDPVIEGWVRDATSATERDCDCYSPQVCLHFPDLDTREPPLPERGYSPPTL